MRAGSIDGPERNRMPYLGWKLQVSSGEIELSCCSAAPQRTAHTMLRPGTLAHYAAAGRYGSAGQAGHGGHSAGQSYRRSRASLDYASDTEATCAPTTRSSYYYYRDRSGAHSAHTTQGEYRTMTCVRARAHQGRIRFPANAIERISYSTLTASNPVECESGRQTERARRAG